MIKKLKHLLAWIFCRPSFFYTEKTEVQEDISNRQRHYHLSKDDLH